MPCQRYVSMSRPWWVFTPFSEFHPSQNGTNEAAENFWEPTYYFNVYFFLALINER